MKTRYIYQTVLSIFSVFYFGVMNAQGVEGASIPAFISNPPDKSKPLASYTPADVFSCVVIAELPDGHPIRPILSQGCVKLKTEWPGAKEGSQIQALMKLILDAVPSTSKEDSKKSLQSIRFILYFIMDISDTEKADAVVSVVEQQTDPLKKRLAAEMAYDLFFELYDARLIQYMVEYVDDTDTFVLPQRKEGYAPQTVSVGGFISGSLMKTFIDLGFDRAELPAATTDKALRKSNFKAWMQTHMGEISQKCKDWKARPEFWVNPPKRISWSARP